MRRLTFYHKLAVVTKLVALLAEHAEPLALSLLRAIRPRTRPLVVAPRIAHDDEALPTAFARAQDGISVRGPEALHGGVPGSH